MKTTQPSARLLARTRRIIAFPALIGMVMVLNGCAVGPDYRRPEATTIPSAYAGVSDEWKVAAPQAHLPKGNWWEIFRAPELSRLEAEAGKANQGPQGGLRPVPGGPRNSRRGALRSFPFPSRLVPARGAAQFPEHPPDYHSW